MKKLLIVITIIFASLFSNAQNKTAIVVDDLIAPIAYNCQDIQEIEYEIVSDSIILINPFSSFTDVEHELIIVKSSGDFIVPKQNTFVDFGRGEIYIESMNSIHKDKRKSTVKLAGYSSTFEDGVIRFRGVDSFKVYINNSESRTNSTGMFAIYFDKQKFYDELKN